MHGTALPMMREVLSAELRGQPRVGDLVLGSVSGEDPGCAETKGCYRVPDPPRNP
jgi:hypothetical protein